jgi:diacylglycerol kinase (ATP)
MTKQDSTPRHPPAPPDQTRLPPHASTRTGGQSTHRLWSIGSIARATRHGLRGLRDAWRHEAAFKQEAAAALLLSPVAVVMGSSWVESALLLLCLALVLVVELLNTAIEATIDRIGTDHHELSRMAKDLGAGAVMVSIGLAAIVWGMAFFHWWTAAR